MIAGDALCVTWCSYKRPGGSAVKSLSTSTPSTLHKGFVQVNV